MADFFKGLTGGFQTGLQFGQQLRQRRMEDELAQAYAKPQEYVDYSPEGQKQIQGLLSTGAYDIQAVPGAEGTVPTMRFTPRQGLDLQGDMPAAPVDIAPQRVQRYGDQTTTGTFNPTELRGLQMQEAARVLGSYGDVRGAAALQAQAEEQAYQAKRRPLELQGLETQQRLSAFQVGKAEEEAAVAGRSRQFSEWYSQNPNAPFADISAKAKELRMTPTEQFKVASDITGISKTEMENNATMLKKLTQGKGYQELLQLHKDSDLIDPSSHFEAIPGKDGKVALQRVDTKTGKPIGGIVFSGSEAEVTKYLSTAANAPETIVDFTINLEAKRASIVKDLAAADNYRADAKLRERKAQEEKAAKVMDDATVKKLNDLSTQILDADARGDAKEANRLYGQWTREYATGATQMGKVVQAKQPGLAKSLTPEQDSRYKELIKSPKWERAKTSADKAALLRADGIPPESVGFGGRQDVYAGDRETEAAGATTTPAPVTTTAPTPAPVGLRTGGERNPYVDARGRPIANPPTVGEPAPITRLIPTVQSAGRAVSAGLDTATVRYLESKISRGEPLSPAEQVRAESMGLYR